MKRTRWFLRNARDYEVMALSALQSANFWQSEGEGNRAARRLRTAARLMRTAGEQVRLARDSDPDAMMWVEIHPHQTDRDCDLDENAVCLTCHVWHGGGCSGCDGQGFHEPGCPDMDPAEAVVSKARSEDRPYCCGAPMQPRRGCQNCGSTMAPEWESACLRGAGMDLTPEQEEMEYQHGASLGDPRRCPRHPGVMTSSPDGMHDSPCGLCELAMEQEGRR